MRLSLAQLYFGDFPDGWSDRDSHPPLSRRTRALDLLMAFFVGRRRWGMYMNIRQRSLQSVRTLCGDERDASVGQFVRFV